MKGKQKKKNINDNLLIITITNYGKIVTFFP